MELNDAWKLVKEQYLKKAEDTARENGPGMSVFVLLPKRLEDGTNCRYIYTGRGDALWNKVSTLFAEFKRILEVYRPETMFMVNVNIPSSDEETIGSIKIFNLNTNEEIEY